jgi:hypothetical protein
MNCARLFLKPVAALFALVLMATAAAPSTAGAKESLQKAADKAYDMYMLAEKGDLEGAIPVAEATLEYTETAYDELDALARNSHNGGYDRSQRDTGEARDWLIQTIKDAKAKDAKDTVEHALKARGSLNHALDEFPKS